MSDAILFLAAPFVMCLILVGIHCYLGLHVLARGVIFVDLALAQVAALGSVFALLFGFEHSDKMTYFVSLSGTIIAALFLALANRYRNRLSQEALIGILYACATASVVLLVDKMSHGAEHIKYALVGQLLWVTWSDVLKVVLIYSVVSVVHYIFRKQLLDNSFGKNIYWKWDFLFYALFGVVITSSVHVAGVLLVFSFLIVPAVLSSLFFKGIFQRLLFGWAVGSFLSILGMSLSYLLDLPAGALIVVVFTLFPILLVLGMRLVRFT
jgi:zinc/manganese transport system permease protein